MKPYLPLVVLAMLLSGCPDPKIPKVPPKVPEPKVGLDATAKPPASETASRM